MTSNGFLVTEKIVGAHFSMKDYPLYPDDLLTQHEDGTFFKEGPGLGIGGFELTEEQVATLKPVNFQFHGLNYGVTAPEEEA